MPMTAATPQPCPLCRGRNSAEFWRDRFRPYLRCADCALVFVPAAYHISAEQEKAEYDLHQNDPQDPGYRKFLARLFEPLRQRLAPAASGLDFGCGPGPTLSLLFQEAGYPVALYDKFYADHPQALQTNYDFITASEVVEHLHAPGAELERLYQRLNSNGILGIMTKLVTGREAFSSWHYKNDRTHICFFSAATFVWLGQRWQAQVEFFGKDVILLTKLR